jgi:23S rRNA (adenine2503-C2)-methyltransferase
MHTDIMIFEQFTTSQNLPKFRLTQIRTAYYKQFIRSWEDLTTWPKNLREALEKNVPFSRLIPAKIITSANGDTVKVLFRRVDGTHTESVLMKHKDGRSTVCVSCMVGCPVGCAFCATGKMGFISNLTAEEMVDQVLYFERLLTDEAKEVTNIVFMGMGEPLLNLFEVEKAITTITDESFMGLGIRRITISTSGIIPQLKKLVDDGYKGHIALSLHAPNQKLRESIMPIAKKFPLEALMDAADYVVEKTGRRVSYEYILIDGVNDSKENAEELAHLLKNRLSHVNCIPCNEVPGLPYKKPSQERIWKFIDVLKAHRQSYTLRVTMGDDIKAACGQLAGQM